LKNKIRKIRGRRENQDEELGGFCNIDD